jgi:transcriptional regulator with XRE-family HTH domain
VVDIVEELAEGVLRNDGPDGAAPVPATSCRGRERLIGEVGTELRHRLDAFFQPPTQGDLLQRLPAAVRRSRADDPARGFLRRNLGRAVFVVLTVVVRMAAVSVFVVHLFLPYVGCCRRETLFTRDAAVSSTNKCLACETQRRYSHWAVQPRGGANLETVHIDIDQLADYVQWKMDEEDLSLRQAARKAQVSPATLSRILQKGKKRPRPDVETLARLVRWVEVPIEKIIEARPETRPARIPPKSTVETIQVHLRADKNLSADAARAIAEMVKVAYAQFAKQQKR